MPVFTKHAEQHFTSSAVVRDVVIGMSDGLTVPFALAAGISGAIASSRIVVTAGVAEVAAGAIAMALGGYLRPEPTSSTTAASSNVNGMRFEIFQKPSGKKYKQFSRPTE